MSNIFKNQKEKLQLLYPVFDALRWKNNLLNKEFAELIVSCIQDIPYTLILQNDCDPGLYEDPFIQDYLLNKEGNCLGNIKYGLLTPSEFWENLDGDCDTRTLLLFTILSHYGFDVAILSSNIYKHSILGINLPYKGVYKKIHGKRYYVWETTSKGFKPGMLPAKIADMRYWEPSLLNK